MLLPLTHLKAIVTGGSRGIGFAIAQNFAKLGATVYLVARSPEPLHAAATRINTTIQPSTTPTPTPPTDIDRPGPFYQNATESAVRFVGTIRSETSSPPPSFSSVPRFATALVGDVSLEETWDSILSKVECPDILVNAAGVAQTSLLYKTSVEEIDSILNANLRSTILGCRAAGRAMMKRARQSRQMGQLSIINVSSVMATSGQAGAAAYAASKAGILGLTTALSREYGHFGVRVNAILPGYIDTDMITDRDHKFLSSKVPLGRLGTADEVADAAVFLACNPYANNCHLTIDGGMSGGAF